MPTHEYECNGCGRVYEVFFKSSGEVVPSIDCEVKDCDGLAEKIVSLISKPTTGERSRAPAESSTIHNIDLDTSYFRTERNTVGYTNKDGVGELSADVDDEGNVSSRPPGGGIFEFGDVFGIGKKKKEDKPKKKSDE